MVLRSVPIIAVVLFASLLGSQPARAENRGNETVAVTVSGTVWIDENVDGRRQRSEPAVPPNALVNFKWQGRVVSGDRTDERGRFTFEINYNRYVSLDAYYLKPGAGPVRENGPVPYTHHGCAYFYVPPGESRLKLDIRLVPKDVEEFPQPVNWEVAGGHFFKEAADIEYQFCDAGFSVTNADGIPFWDTWQRFGLDHLGYPISHRFVWKGFVTQAFQRAIFQWQPGKGVVFLNVFDELHAAGVEAELRRLWDTPVPLGPSFDAGKSSDQIARDRLALLDANPAIKERYFAAPDPLLLYGLPISRVEKFGPISKIMTQKAMFHQWVGTAPQPDPGEVTIVNSGTIGRDFGWICGYTEGGCVHWFFPDDGPYRDRWTYYQRPPALIAQHFSLASTALTPEDTTPDYSEGYLTVSGVVWVDENADGIRNISEPVLPRFGLRVVRSTSPRDFKFIGTRVETDDQGRYSFRLKTPNRYRYLLAYYRKPGEPIYLPTPIPYTHSGCALIYTLPDEGHRTVDIRVTRRSPPKNWSVAGGHFFRETSGAYHLCDSGFSVTNADGIPFWDTWQRLGLENVGYPISHRYMWRGFVTQAFQKAIFQWQPGRGVFFINVFDELHAAGYDERLFHDRSTPFQLPTSFDSDDVTGEGYTWEEIHRRRLALLDENPAIRERYYSAPDPLLQYGLPTSRVEDFGNLYAIRTQRAVIQQWKEDYPWAKAGEVTIANGGDIVKELEWLPCRYRDTLPRCKRLFFFDDPTALIPQPAGFIGVRLR